MACLTPVACVSRCIQTPLKALDSFQSVGYIQKRYVDTEDIATLFSYFLVKGFSVFDLTRFTLSDMVRCGAAIRSVGVGTDTMEEAARKLVFYFRDHLVNKTTRERSCPLVQFYKTYRYEDLDMTLRQSVQDTLGTQTPHPDTRILTLLSTTGTKSQWNLREYFLGAVPLVSERGTKQFPLISQLAHQCGFKMGGLCKSDPDIIVNPGQKTYNVLHIADAIGNRYLPNQERFVIPYGIKSVIGFGGLLPYGDLFSLLLFSQAPISRETASLFNPLVLCVKVAILPYDGRVVHA